MWEIFLAVSVLTGRGGELQLGLSLGYPFSLEFTASPKGKVTGRAECWCTLRDKLVSSRVVTLGGGS